MHRALFVRDRRSPWGKTLVGRARARGWHARLIDTAGEIDRPGFGFIRPHTNPRKIGHDMALAREMPRRLMMVTDRAQVEVYDNKRAQFRRWAHWMPETWVFEDAQGALDFAEAAPLPLISKADEGASSQNVRLIEDRAGLREHIRRAFAAGLPIRHCSGDGARGLQKGYLLLQRFIPHEVTYRVNAVGRQRAVFFRRCYPDKPMAQTGNVTPAYRVEDVPAGLLAFADRFFAEAGTQWCSVDILRDGNDWRLLETSLAWPHPSPGDCNNAGFFPCGRKWIDMWDVLLDEIESGAWS